MTQTHPYRVRDGAVLPQNGELLEGGARVDLTRAVGHDVRHLVEPLDPAGNVIDPPTPEQVELEERPVHEHVSILQHRRALAVASLAELQAVATDARRTADAAQGDVAKLTAVIAAIDAELAKPAPEPEPIEASKPSRATRKYQTSPPDAPAEKAQE